MIYSTVFEAHWSVRHVSHIDTISIQICVFIIEQPYGGSSIGYHAKRIRSDRKSEDEIYVKIAHGSRQTSLLKLEICSFETK